MSSSRGGGNVAPTEHREFAAYSPGVGGGIAAVVRDVAIGALLGAGFVFVIGMAFALLEEVAHFDIEDLGMPNEGRLMLGIVVAVVVPAGLLWPLANRAEQLGVIRTLRRGAVTTPEKIPPRYQRALLHATEHNKVPSYLGWGLLMFFGVLGVISFFVMFFKNDGGVGTILFAGSAALAVLGWFLTRWNGAQSAGNLRRRELSAQAANIWSPGNVARAENAAAKRARTLTIVPLPRYRALGWLGRIVTWPGSALMFLALFVLTSWQPNDDLRRVSKPPPWLQDTLHIWAVVFAVGLIIAVVGSGITGCVLVLRAGAMRRMLRDVDVRHERPPLDDLGIALGDDPASRRWARTLIGMALPVAFFTHLVVYAARLEVSAMEMSALAGSIFLVLGLAGSVLSVTMQTGLATRMLAAFAIRDKETRRTNTVLDADD